MLCATGVDKMGKQVQRMYVLMGPQIHTYVVLFIKLFVVKAKSLQA